MTGQFLVVLVLLASLAAINGCGAGGSAPASGGNTTPFQSPSGAGTAALAWDAPSTNVDGTRLTDLAGYKIYVGISSGAYMASVDAGNVANYSMNNLMPGTYYFVVTAYNTTGTESGYSNDADKTIL